MTVGDGVLLAISSERRPGNTAAVSRRRQQATVDNENRDSNDGEPRAVSSCVCVRMRRRWRRQTFAGHFGSKDGFVRFSADETFSKAVYSLSAITVSLASRVHVVVRHLIAAKPPEVGTPRRNEQRRPAMISLFSLPPPPSPTRWAMLISATIINMTYLIILFCVQARARVRACRVY